MKPILKRLFFGAVVLVGFGFVGGIVGAMRRQEIPKDAKKPFETVAHAPQFGSFELDGWLDLPGWGAAAKAAVASRLKDAGSAKFETIFAVGDKKIGGLFPVIVCGKVSAKNSFGGYNGAEPFVFYPAGNALTFSSHQAIKEWNAYCAGPHQDPPPSNLAAGK